MNIIPPPYQSDEASWGDRFSRPPGGGHLRTRLTKIARLEILRFGPGIALDRLLAGKEGGRSRRRIGQRIPGIVRAISGWAITLLIILIGCIFSSARDHNSKLAILSGTDVFADGAASFVLFAIDAVAGISLYHGLEATGKSSWSKLEPDAVRAPVELLTLIFLVIAFYPTEFQPLLYFQSS